MKLVLWTWTLQLFLLWLQHQHAPLCLSLASFPCCNNIAESTGDPLRPMFDASWLFSADCWWCPRPHGQRFHSWETGAERLEERCCYSTRPFCSATAAKSVHIDQAEIQRSRRLRWGEQVREVLLEPQGGKKCAGIFKVWTLADHGSVLVCESGRLVFELCRVLLPLSS